MYGLAFTTRDDDRHGGIHKGSSSNTANWLNPVVEVDSSTGSTGSNMTNQAKNSQLSRWSVNTVHYASC